MFDLHCHSEFSIDSSETMASATKLAIERNFKTICFTDHVDLSPEHQTQDTAFIKDHYFQELNRVKYSNRDKIEILSGVEIGMVPGLADRYNQFLSTHSFDYVILSLHTMNNRDIAYDWTQNELPEIALHTYYDEMLKCINEYNNFDVLGHMDYIDRYFPDKSIVPSFSSYKNKVKKILKVLIEKDKGLELNTGSLRSGLFYFHPKIEILLMYRDLGGKVITLGSDAHNKNDIGLGIRDAMRLLRELGYKNTYKYIQRKKYALPLG